MIASICEVVKHDCEYFRKGVLSWTYYKLPCTLSWLDLSEQGKLDTGPCVLFHFQVSFKIFVIFYTKG